MRLYKITVSDGDKQYTGDFWDNYKNAREAVQDAIEYYVHELGNNDIHLVKCTLCAK